MRTGPCFFAQALAFYVAGKSCAMGLYSDICFAFLTFVVRILTFFVRTKAKAKAKAKANAIVQIRTTGQQAKGKSCARATELKLKIRIKFALLSDFY
jgi:hypothetical protein